ncbi:MAG: CNNM domain-containing protein [Planctomycetota bacterium]
MEQFVFVCWASAAEPLTWSTPLYMGIALALVAINGFFVLAEFSIVKVRASRIEELARRGDARAQAARHILTNLDGYLSATQLGITVASLALGWVGEPAFAAILDFLFGKLGWSSRTTHTLSVALAFFVITLLHILIGEVAPKSLAIRRPEELTLSLSRPLRWLYILFYLPMLLLNGASNLLLGWIGLAAEGHDVAHTEQELRMLLSTAQTSGGFSLNRMLILENIFDLGQQTVSAAMIPWSQVHFIQRGESHAQVLRAITETRYSRYPVVEPDGLPRHYLLMKDLIVQTGEAGDWTKVLRPLPNFAPDSNLEVVMQRLQGDGANMAVVIEGGRPVGLITLEDILEEVVGRIEDEYPRLPRLYLKDALSAGGVVLDLAAETPQDAIREMAAVIPAENYPAGVDLAALAIAREQQMSTAVGHQVAIPHARCPGLNQALLVLGKSVNGIEFDTRPNTTGQPVRLVFLLVTPADRPQVQVFFLAQLAHVAASELVRERISRASSASEVIAVIAAADPAVTG